MSEGAAANASVQSAKGKVLVVSYFLPPDISPGSLRMSGIMDGLIRRRWDVSAISVKSTPPATRDDSSLTRLPSGIEMVRTSHWDLYGWLRKTFGLDAKGSRIDRPNGSIGRPPSRGDRTFTDRMRRMLRLPAVAACRLLDFPDRYAGWIPPLILRAGKMIGDKKIDIVLSSSPPHSSHLALYLLSYVRRFKWVTDFRDPWTVPDRRGRGGFVMELRRLLERRILRRCDRIIANTPGNRSALLDTFAFLDRSKVTVITNAFEVNEPDMVEEGEEQDHAGGARECDFIYTGEIYLGMLDLLLDAMRIIAGRKSAFQPVIHIYGLIHQQDLAEISRLGLEENFKYYGFVPYRRSLRIMKDAKALLLLLPHGGDSTSWVPSKLYRYLGSGRPVLGIAPQGDATCIIEETGAGTAITDTDPEAVADKLCDFVSSLRRGTPPVERNEEEIRRYSMDAIVSQLDGILMEEMGN